MVKPTYVILAAGRGRRLWPVGEALPKCMIRVLGKPLLEWNLDRILPNASKVVVVVGYKKEMVIDHFSNGKYSDKIVFAEQEEQKGTANALLQAKPFVDGDFVTFNADSFADPSLFKLLDEEASKGKPFGVGQYVEDARQWGVFDVQSMLIKRVVEKPKEASPGYFALGNNFFPKEFFDLLEKVELSPRGEYELTDAYNAFASKNDVRFVEYSGYRSEMTYFWNHLDINIHALENLMEDRREGTVEPGAVVDGKLFLGKGSIIKAGTRVEGPAYIGENCLIGPNAFIRTGSVIEDNCHVGTCEIKNSVIMNRANVPHFSYVGDSVLCEDVNLGAGTMIANLRFDNGPVAVRFKEGVVASGRRKLGAAIGSGTKVGVNCSINCGILIGHNCKIYPGVSVKHNLDNETVFRGDE
ncbi:NTP transferase domain-containing protein [Candidatus Micrarchaeota archaeon]|nr:NTP transferase domain-containing protein [Candidatus Micrarchaeota archaeon]